MRLTTTEAFTTGKRVVEIAIGNDNTGIAEDMATSARDAGDFGGTGAVRWGASGQEICAS
jgi:hypothetical protein